MGQVWHLLASQPPPEPGSITSIAQLIQAYGGWGLAALMMVVCAFLFTKFVEARDKIDVALQAQIVQAQAQVKGSTDLVEELTKASVDHTHALTNVSEALKTVERRLENVEKRTQ